MTKGTLLQQIWDDLPEKRKTHIQEQAAQKIEEYRTLQQLRKKAGLTQANVSKKLNMSQSNVSRLEKNSDMLLSTLQGYIETIGGKLNLTVELPNSPPIPLTGLGDLMGENSPQASRD